MQARIDNKIARYFNIVLSILFLEMLLEEEYNAEL